MTALFCTEVSPQDAIATVIAPSEQGNPANDRLTAKMDDKSLRYLLAVHPAFDSFRTAASQLAGLLVLVAAGAKGGAPDRAMLNAATLAHAEAADRLRGLAATERVRHLHYHLCEAAQGIGAALAAAKRQAQAAPRAFDVSAVFDPLCAAYRQLQFASRLAPGFPLVDTRDSCCALAR